MIWRWRGDRARTERGLWRASAAALLVASAGCGNSASAITKADTTVTTAPRSTTSAAPTTTEIPVTTAPIVAAPTTVPPITVAPTTGEHAGDGDVGATPTDVVRPAAAWVGFGIPQPGSMFENLHEDHSLDGKGKFVALTFDDGPSQYTQPIVDILRFMGVQATFFQITNQSEKNPEVVKMMVAAGMHVGAHTKAHKRLPEISPDEQNEQVAGSIDALRGIVGADVVKCFRPPYAGYDQHVIDLAVGRQTAMAMWSFDTLDWKKPAWTSLVVRVVNETKDRQVILMHDGGGDRAATIAALPWIIQGLRDKGFQFIPIC